MPHPVAEETASDYAFVALVGLRAEDPLAIFRAVQKGLSITALETFQRRSGLSTTELSDAIIVTARTLARRKEQGRLEPEESDRLLRVARVFAKALDLFDGDADQTRAWLSVPQRALGGVPPLVLARTDLGAREVEALAERLEHGVLT
jgi:putative toxin-antitoxin system antitoxin component (TIGR02293 family)